MPSQARYRIPNHRSGEHHTYPFGAFVIDNVNGVLLTDKNARYLIESGVKIEKVVPGDEPPVVADVDMRVEEQARIDNALERAEGEAAAQHQATYRRDDGETVEEERLRLAGENANANGGEQHFPPDPPAPADGAQTPEAIAAAKQQEAMDANGAAAAAIAEQTQQLPIPKD